MGSMLFFWIPCRKATFSGVPTGASTVCVVEGVGCVCGCTH